MIDTMIHVGIAIVVWTIVGFLLAIVIGAMIESGGDPYNE